MDVDEELRTLEQRGDRAAQQPVVRSVQRLYRCQTIGEHCGEHSRARQCQLNSRLHRPVIKGLSFGSRPRQKNSQPPQKMLPIFAAKPVLKPARHRKAPRTVAPTPPGTSQAITAPYKRFLLRLPEKIVAVKKIAAPKLQAAGEKTLTPI